MIQSVGIKTGNAAVDAIITVIDWMVDRYLPEAYGEVRPTRGYLYFGITLLVAFGGLFLWLSFFAPYPHTDTAITRIVFAIIAAGGILLCSLYFRARSFFRSYGIHRYSWGRYRETIPYASFSAAEIGYWSAFRFRRHDGSYWNLPTGDVYRVLRQVLWSAQRSGVPIPDMTSLQNRFGVTSLEGAGRQAWRRAQGRL